LDISSATPLSNSHIAIAIEMVNIIKQTTIWRLLAQTNRIMVGSLAFMGGMVKQLYSFFEK